MRVQNPAMVAQPLNGFQDRAGGSNYDSYKLATEKYISIPFIPNIIFFSPVHRENVSKFQEFSSLLILTFNLDKGI